MAIPYHLWSPERKARAMESKKRYKQNHPYHTWSLQQKARACAQAKRWRANNLAKVKAARKRRSQQHSHKLRERERARHYRRLHPHSLWSPGRKAKYNARMRRWNTKHRDKVNAVIARWRARNPDKAKAIRDRANARRRTQRRELRLLRLLSLPKHHRLRRNCSAADLVEARRVRTRLSARSPEAKAKRLAARQRRKQAELAISLFAITRAL